MTFRITDELKRTFDLANLKHQASKDLNADDWKKFRGITDKYADMRRFEKNTYEDEYKTRVEVARKRLINQAGEKNKDFKHRWFGRDQFDKPAIQRQAERTVRGQYNQLVAGIDDLEAREIGQLLDTSEKRSQLREKPKQDFEKTVDRRARDGLPKDRRQRDR